MKFRSGLSIVLAAIALAGLVVTPQTAFGQARVRVYVPNPPPAAPVEVIGVAPSHRHAWVNGYHRWDGHAYAWVPGRWAVRPRAHVKWAPGRWERHSRGYYWVDGRWR